MAGRKDQSCWPMSRQPSCMATPGGRCTSMRELGMETCRSVSTPLSLTVEKEGDRSDRPEVSAELATKHRAAVARVVYLGQDRIDWIWEWRVELAKTVAIPREGDNERLNRVVRSLHGNPDYVQWYPLQEETNTVSCPRMLIGPHVAKHVVQI